MSCAACGGASGAARSSTTSGSGSVSCSRSRSARKPRSRSRTPTRTGGNPSTWCRPCTRPTSSRRSRFAALSGPRRRVRGRRAARDFFPVALAAALFAANLLAALNHSMWRDEWAAWLFARGSATFPDAVTAFQYAGRGWFGWFGFAGRRSTSGYDPNLVEICHVLIHRR